MNLIISKLKEARELIGLTQLEAAELSGISQRDVSQLENGKKEFIPTIYIQFLNNRGIDINSIFSSKIKKVQTLTGVISQNENINNINTDQDIYKLCDEKTERIKELKDQIALLTNINEDIKQQLNMKKDILMECMERNRTLNKELEIMQNIVETKIITDRGNTVKPEKKIP